MKVAITGSHGLIGSALVPRLTAAGHAVIRVVRGAAGPGEASWDPAGGTIDIAALGGVDAAIHLAGVGIADRRWSAAHKAAVFDSRVRGTRVLAEALARLEPRPSVLLSGSAVGYYGDRGGEDLTESSEAGTGFLAEVCRQWEAAASPADDAGIRVLRLRTGIVLSPAGGALAKQLPLFRLGVGGRLGSGRQYMSWIALDDDVAAIAFALTADGLRGAANLTAPNPVTNAELAAAIGRALHRPAALPVPAAALKIALGRQMATEMLLGGAKVLPRALQEAGYAFAHPEVEEALGTMLS